MFSLSSIKSNSGYIERFMFLICLLYAVGMNMEPIVGRFAEVILTLSLIYIIKKKEVNLLQSRFIKLILLSFVLISCTWLSVKLFHPDIYEMKYRFDLRYFARLFIFIPIAYWLKQNIERLNIFWLVSAMTVLVSTFYSGDGVAEWIRGINGSRVDFDIVNAQHTSLYMGICWLGIMLYAIPTTWASRSLSKVNKLSLISIFAFMWIVFGTGLIISQTRGVWIAVLFSLICTAFLYCKSKKVNLFKPKTLLILIAASVGIAISLYSLGLFEFIEHRMLAEEKTVDILLTKGIESVPYTSSGLRLHAWYASIDWIMSKPILGWGDYIKVHILKLANIPTVTHLHNYYLEVMASFGVLGLLLFSYFYYLIFSKLNQLFSERYIGLPLVLFTVATLILLLIANTFESFNTMRTGYYIHNVLLAGMYTFYLQKLQYGQPKTDTP